MDFQSYDYGALEQLLLGEKTCFGDPRQSFAFRG